MPNNNPPGPQPSYPQPSYPLANPPQSTYPAPNRQPAPQDNFGAAQVPNGSPQAQDRTAEQRTASGAPNPMNADVRILGNQSVSTNRILARLKSRPGRYFDPDLLQADTEELNAMRSFRDVRAYTQETGGGLVITFEVVERPVVDELRILGNREIGDRGLMKQIDIEVGDPLDIFTVRLARQNIEEFYHEKGYPHTEVEVLEGNDPSHRRVIFLVHEDHRRRVWSTQFVGNTIASDARLRTFVKTKPLVRYLFDRSVDEAEIENDVKRITAYYRSLGFFNARVGREILYDENDGWLTLRFVIDEGPQYVIENVAIAGNQKFSNEQLMEMLELTSGTAFNADKMQRDINSLKDLYGGLGHIAIEVVADPLFLEEPGRMELVYQIDEGDIYRIRHINVHIAGDYGVTKRRVVLDRVSLAPGDVIDVREVRNSERRLGASGLFAGDPGTGQPPRIEITPLDTVESERLTRQLIMARGDSVFRGQSPDTGTQWLDLNYYFR